jgi:agmatinase
MYRQPTPSTIPMNHKLFADSTFLSAGHTGDPTYLIIGVPFDSTSSFRKGSMHGPDALRQASYNFESYLPDLDIDLQDLSIVDAGDVDEAGSTEDLQAILSMELDELLGSLKFPQVFPIILGGEHSLTPMVLGSMLPRFPETDGKIGVLYLDAHLDMRESYLGNPMSHACAARRVSDKVGLDNIIPVGIRSMSREESDFITPHLQDHSFQYYGVNDVRDEGAKELGDAILNEFLQNGCDRIYLSIDMDVFDPSIAPGVGNPEPGGLGYQDVLSLIKPMAKYLCGMDLVETNPVYDQGITALLGAKVIREIIGMHFHARTL